jgi:hypothetical protein
MSYRYRIYSIDKKIAEKLQKCTSLEEYLEAAKKYKEKLGEPFNAGDFYQYANDYAYFPFYEFGDELFNFGSGYDNAGNMQRLGKPLFADAEFAKNFEDFEPFVIGKEGLVCAIEDMRNKIIANMEDALTSKPRHSWDPEDSGERCRMYIQDRLDEWSKFKELGNLYNVYNLGSKDNIASSWLYEFEIFDLVRIYKTFNWENDVMLFYGW